MPCRPAVEIFPYARPEKFKFPLEPVEPFAFKKTCPRRSEQGRILAERLAGRKGCELLFPDGIRSELAESAKGILVAAECRQMRVPGKYNRAAARKRLVETLPPPSLHAKDRSSEIVNGPWVTRKTCLAPSSDSIASITG